MECEPGGECKNLECRQWLANSVVREGQEWDSRQAAEPLSLEGPMSSGANETWPALTKLEAMERFKIKLQEWNRARRETRNGGSDWQMDMMASGQVRASGQIGGSK